MKKRKEEMRDKLRKYRTTFEILGLRLKINKTGFDNLKQRYVHYTLKCIAGTLLEAGVKIVTCLCQSENLIQIKMKQYVRCL